MNLEERLIQRARQHAVPLGTDKEMIDKGYMSASEEFDVDHFGIKYKGQAYRHFLLLNWLFVRYHKANEPEEIQWIEHKEKP